MKLLYTLILSMLICSTAVATTIVAKTTTGKWSLNTNWNLNRLPRDQDTVVIPASFNFKVDANESLDNVVIIVRGTLTFTNGKLRLDSDSRVIVEVGGRITGNGNNDQITISNTMVYRGSQPDVIGFAMADITTGNSFLGFLLPVHFLAFDVVKADVSVIITWSTTNELNNNYFEIQKSLDGRTWSRVGAVPASTTTSNDHYYRFVDESKITSTTFYRIKQVDLNGKSAYTKVIAVNGNSVAASRLYKSGNNLIVEFAENQVAGVHVRILKLNGQLISSHKLNNFGTKVTLPMPVAYKGICVVQVLETNAQYAEKILL